MFLVNLFKPKADPGPRRDILQELLSSKWSSLRMAVRTNENTLFFVSAFCDLSQKQTVKTCTYVYIVKKYNTKNRLSKIIFQCFLIICYITHFEERKKYGFGIYFKNLKWLSLLRQNKISSNFAAADKGIWAHTPTLVYVVHTTHTSWTHSHTLTLWLLIFLYIHLWLTTAISRVSGCLVVIIMSAMSWHLLLLYPFTKSHTMPAVKQSSYNTSWSTLLTSHTVRHVKVVTSFTEQWEPTALQPRKHTQCFTTLRRCVLQVNLFIFIQYWFSTSALFPILSHLYPLQSCPESPRHTETSRESRPWQPITVSPSARPMNVRISILAISMEMGSQWEDSKWPAVPHFDSQSRGAQESQTGNRCSEDTIQVSFTIVRCCLFFSLDSVVNKWLPWEPCWQRKRKPFVMHPGLAAASSNKSLENLELPNCQSAWLDVTLCSPSGVFVVIYFISYFSNSLSLRPCEDMPSVWSHSSSLHR